MTIIAGSNGCGKSTLTSLREMFQRAPLLDPDAIAKSVSEVASTPMSNLEAGRRVLLLAEEMISAERSFAVETTLSGETYLRMAARVKRAGYRVHAILIGTDSVEINLQRVRARVERGGHDIPEEDQRRRFPRTLRNMGRLLSLADSAVIFDNSTENGHRLLASAADGTVEWVEPVPEWATVLR